MKIKSIDELPAVRTYLARIDAEVRSMRRAVVREIAGNYWRDIAVIKFNKDGSVEAPEQYKPTDLEEATITQELSTATFPQLLVGPGLLDLPDEIKEADPEDVFKFKNAAGDCIMLQVRRDTRDGGKAYVPWTYWDDEVWRKTEPDGMLPLWGLEQIGAATTVFIHEGAKAARAMQRMAQALTPNQKMKLKSHPWGLELSKGAHVGWIGGALSPARTDWRVLKKMGIKTAYIVSDNDPPGLAAVPAISYQLQMPTFHVQFTSEWPACFDLADEFPDCMFRKVGDVPHYTGPVFEDCAHPATWMTDQIANPKGRPSIKLRSHAKSIWAYVRDVDEFICIHKPHLKFRGEILNKELAAFSHSTNTAQLINKAYGGETHTLCYRPDSSFRIITHNGAPSINRFVPSTIRSVDGDIEPWEEFLEYLLPDAKERVTVEKWLATLIARPGNRIEFGLLLVSEAHGIGKTTLAAKILPPLVGEHNVSYPDESQITGEFTDWVAEKRLAIVSEIYAGHSWKVYNKVKSVMTDETISVNVKYQRPYKVENWVHVIGCSNSSIPLKMEEDDRRWFYPTLTEEQWPKNKFDDLHNWLISGGLGIIKSWADEYHDYFNRGDRPPMTARKRDLIEESQSQAEKLAAELGNALDQHPEPAAVAMTDIKTWIKNSISETVFDSDDKIRKAMKKEGVIQLPTRYRIQRGKQYVLVNATLHRELSKQRPGGTEIARARIKDCLIAPGKLIEPEM